MQKHHKDILLGIAVGFVGTALGVLLYMLIFSKLSIEQTLKEAYNAKFLGALIGYGALVNFLSFFGFLKIGYDYRAKGVLIASLITALVVLILKFI